MTFMKTRNKLTINSLDADSHFFHVSQTDANGCYYSKLSMHYQRDHFSNNLLVNDEIADTYSVLDEFYFMNIYLAP